MAVVVETTLGDITVDLFLKERPRACQNFLKLCKLKYYNYNLFHTVSRGFIAQTGDPTGSRNGGESLFGVLDGPLKRFFVAENNPKIKHTIMGLISFVGNEENMIGSQFFFTLGDELTYLDDKHCVFGQVTEGLDVLELINEAICDAKDRPYQDIRITHTVILDDPLPNLEKMVIPSRSPSPSAERLQGGRIAPDEEIDETAGKSLVEINELIADREAKARATILEMVGDLPDAEMAPPENVLFVCKLNPVTTDDDLEIIFSRFGKIKSCEVIRDHKTGDSLQYAFVEFAEQKSCEDAYFKMDNVLIDDRRIHVDFSQSVSKIKWMGKGRGVKHFDEKSDRGNKDRIKKEPRSYHSERKYDRRESPSRRRTYQDKNKRRSRSRSPRRNNYNRYYNDRYNNRNRDYSHNQRDIQKKYRDNRPESSNRRRRSKSISSSEENSRKSNYKYTKSKNKESKRRSSSSSQSPQRSKVDDKNLKYSKSKNEKKRRSSSSSSESPLRRVEKVEERKSNKYSKSKNGKKRSSSSSSESSKRSRSKNKSGTKRRSSSPERNHYDSKRKRR